MRLHPVVCVVNQSTVVSDQDVYDLCLALDKQALYHFEPHWNASASFWQWPKTRDLPDQAWALIIADDSDQVGALGYHETTHSGQPIGYVFAKTDQQYGLSWTVTASHEALEMLGDPYANLAAQVDDQMFLAYETADAVEADELGYKIHVNTGRDVLVSDFVFPNWFEPGSTGPWDYKGHLTRSLQILKGGYIGAWTPQKGWYQETNGDVRHKNGPRFQLRKRQAPARRLFALAGTGGPLIDKP